MSNTVVKIIVGVILFAGLPVLGWGVDDLQGFAAHPARLVYVAVVILLQIFIAIQFPTVGQNRGDGKKLVQRQRLAVVLLQVLSLAVVIAAPFSDRRELLALGSGLGYVGLVLFTLGFIGVSWAEAWLGKLFSVQVTIQENHRLITDGPYKLLRHPRYLFIILFNLGIALAFRSGLGLILVAALAGVLLWRISDEETLMHAEFGADWEAYAKRSWRVIPYVY